MGHRVDLEWIAPPFSFDAERTEMIDSTVVLNGRFNERGRGMELSELVKFEDTLLAFDDRSGIIYEISREFEAIPRNIVMEGDSNIAKGLKIEWATYKADEDALYIGSIGREYTNKDGTRIVKLGLLWVAKMDSNGAIRHIDWTYQYMRMREATGTLFPGYLWIEAIEWSDIHRKWFIAPRYVSFEKYDEKLTEHRGANLLMIATEDFSDIELVWIDFDAAVENRNENRRTLLDDTDYRMMSDLSPGQLRGMRVKQQNIKRYLQHSDMTDFIFTVGICGGPPIWPRI